MRLAVQTTVARLLIGTAIIAVALFVVLNVSPKQQCTGIWLAMTLSLSAVGMMVGGIKGSIGGLQLGILALSGVFALLVLFSMLLVLYVIITNQIAML